MRSTTVLAALACTAILVSARGSAQTPASGDLQPPAAFQGIADPQARSRALFTEAAKVITHPRCMNCHPAGNTPFQGNDRHLHRPLVVRGEDGAGIGGNRCTSCHTQANFTLHERASYRSIPGHPRWQVAPIEMAWEGKTIGEICQQIKDTKRNGGRDLALLLEHAAADDLVAWGWAPGEGREPAPGTQKLFGELIKAWIDSWRPVPLTPGAVWP